MKKKLGVKKKDWVHLYFTDFYLKIEKKYPTIQNYGF